MSLEMRKAPLEEEPEPLLALDIGRPALAVASEIGTTSEKNVADVLTQFPNVPRRKHSITK